MPTSEDTSPTLRDLVVTYVVEQLTVLIEAPFQLRLHEPVVHPTRVAVRRLRSTLRVFADLFDEPSAAALEDELLWWAGLLGVVRDLDILERRLDEAVAALPAELVVGPVSSALQRELGLRRKTGWTDIEIALDSDRYGAFSAMLHRWRADIPFADKRDRPGSAVKGYLKRADTKVEKRLAATGTAYAAGEPTADHLAHAARKASKRHRYAAELAKPVLGPKADRVVERRKNLQDVLGNHQDAVLAEQFLRVFGIRVGARRDHNGFTYGLLYAGERAELARLPDQLEPFLP
jgi:CHAD domain-containing protein